ncbi:MAG: YlxR family protein [Oscillospiraceae bacterium]|nr:YlxR family protein [Oscillospiraceae bacterium]
MKHIPERMCVGCRKMKSKRELIKIVRDISDGQIKIDSSQKLFGRGAYICPDDNCLKLSAKKKGFERVFRTQVSYIYDQIGKKIHGG